MILFRVNSTPTYGAYGETLGRKIQYESEVQEDGATKKLIYYKKHDVVRTSIPTDDLIHLKTRSSIKRKNDLLKQVVCHENFYK